MTTTARGTFDVKLNPFAPDDAGVEPVAGRMSIDKQFRGDLVAHSQGQMLAVSTGVKGSAGYVAVERVTGSLGGRRGSFVLQHSGIMDRGAPDLTVTVIPDSGTDELTGLTGRMSIAIAEGRHSYEFEYGFGKPA